ncbi:MASE1 domain-containing protein [Dyella japonica]|uniref:MASE1 domain-containing protein n=1 Tax=Dyella japonica DSM 16301 TaxID=1440762 RepID=A0A0G9H768_9GAMM|nr:MASE1 domain-containing protein [Dyella japonica]KLD65448.1 hypothetical protein Y882_02715 [Dyella japonica DSM 16301]
MRDVWIKSVLLGCGYALLYAGAREVSVSHWLLPAGLRFVALLWLPLRFWPFVLLGEASASFYYRADRLDTFGWPWMLITVLGPLAATSLPVWILRRTRWGRDPHDLATPVTRMLFAGIIASGLGALAGVLAVEAVHYGPTVARVPNTAGHNFAMFVVGDYLGILAMVPLGMTILMGRRRLRAILRCDLAGQPVSAYLWNLCLCALALTALQLMSRNTMFTEVRDVARLAMLIPAVFMTYRYGWMGALPAVLMGNVGIEATILQARETGLVQAQFLMAIVGSGLLLFGSIKTDRDLGLARGHKENQRIRRAARGNLSWSQQWAYHGASILESANATMGGPRADLLVAADAESLANHRWSGSVATQRRGLSTHIDSLRMSDVRAHGLKLALCHGQLRTEIEEQGIRYRAKVSGAFLELPTDMLETTYRLVEGFTLRLANDYVPSKIRVRVIVSRSGPRALAIVVKAWPGPANKKAPDMRAPYFTKHEVNNIAVTYQGKHRDHTDRRVPALAVLLRD